MWVRFIKDFDNNKKDGVVWADDNESAMAVINAGNAVRCLGPDGRLMEDAPPEEINKQLAAEAGVDVLQFEKDIRANRKGWIRNKKYNASLGTYVDENEI